RRGSLRQIGLLHGILPLLLLAGDRERGDRDLRRGLSGDVLPLALVDADRHLHRGDRAHLADHGRKLRGPQGDRPYRRNNRVGRHHSGRRSLGRVYARMFNPTVCSIIMALAAMACLGSLLGWQFTIAQTAKSAAEDRMFPAFFAKVTQNSAPITGMIVMGGVQSLMALSTISP